jgi:hypothetical protein
VHQSDLSVVSRHFYFLHFVQNVGNRNVQKRQINDFGGRNVGNGNVQKRQINDYGGQNVGNRNV